MNTQPTTGERGVFLELARDGKFEEVGTSVSDLVSLSFWGDLGYKRDEAETMIRLGLEPPVTYKTFEEIKRRAGICLRWVAVLKKDLKWSVERIVDTLPLALRAELNGEKWTPPEHKDRWAKTQTI